MAIHYNQSIPRGLCFNFDALNPKCFNTTNRTFTDIISGVTGTTVGDSTKLNLETNPLGDGKPHLKFNPGATTRTAYINFNPANMKLPKGKNMTISFWSYFIDQGNIDHPNVGWETTGAWTGTNGWIFGTGYGTDGPRFGINDNSYYISGGYVYNVWQHWVVTFDGYDTSTGFKTYRNGVIYNTRGITNTSIVGNTNVLNIGATNSRGGNWGGYMDIVQIWDRDLTAAEVKSLYATQKGRFI